MKRVSLRENWRLSLRHRPLLWLAVLGALGAWSGARWALSLAFRDSMLSRAAPIFFAPLLLSFGFAVLVFRWKNELPQLARFCCGLVMMCVLCSASARRVLPPPHDIAFFARAFETQEAPRGPIKPASITLRGWVADFPDRGEFSTQFPLQCAEADFQGRKQVSGRVWMDVPREVNLEVGDAIQVQAALSDLPRAGNFGERENALRFIGNQCWCQGKARHAGDVRFLKAAPRFRFSRVVAGLRARLLAHYEAAFQSLSTPFPHASAQLLTAMAFGEGGLSQPLPRQTRDEFRAAGMSHILVASGTQISFLCLIVLGGARVLGARRWPLLLVLFPILFGYAVLAGGAASIWRASLAGVCVAVAVLQGRDVDALSLWCGAFLALIVLDATQLFDLGFQLSFAATWGLIVVGPTVRRIFSAGLGRNFFCDLAAFSCAAQAGVAPIAAYHFGRLSVAGIGANLLGVPLAGVLVGTAAMDFLLPFQIIHRLNFELQNGIAQTAILAARLPGAQLQAPPLRLLWTASIYGALVVSLLFATWRGNFKDDVWLPLREEVARWWTRRNPRFHRQTFVALALLFCALWMGARVLSTRRATVQISMLDVGQGESIFIRAPSGHTVLIDGGTESQAERGDVGRSVIAPFLQAMNVSKIDVLVVTHADADHCNGLISLVREVPVGMVLDGAQQGDVAATEYLQLRRALAMQKIPVVAARGGQKLNLGAGAVLKVLAPLLPEFRGAKSDNDNAAVLKLEYGKTSALFTADIEQVAEERLARRGENLRCTILKVAHHGSKTSTHDLFLKAAAPQAALISCGRYNKFGHPNGETLGRLMARKISTFRTDVNGEIDVTCDGKECWIQTMR